MNTFLTTYSDRLAYSADPHQISLDGVSIFWYTPATATIYVNPTCTIDEIGVWHADDVALVTLTKKTPVSRFVRRFAHKMADLIDLAAKIGPRLFRYVARLTRGAVDIALQGGCDGLIVEMPEATLRICGPRQFVSREHNMYEITDMLSPR